VNRYWGQYLSIYYDTNAIMLSSPLYTMGNTKARALIVYSNHSSKYRARRDVSQGSPLGAFSNQQIDHIFRSRRPMTMIFGPSESAERVASIKRIGDSKLDNFVEVFNSSAP